METRWTGRGRFANEDFTVFYTLLERSFTTIESRFYDPQWRFLICQWNAHCDDAVSINRSIILIVDYFDNRLLKDPEIAYSFSYRSLKQNCSRPIAGFREPYRAMTDNSSPDATLGTGREGVEVSKYHHH